MTQNTDPGISLLAEFAKAARQGPAIFFAPLRGAVIGVFSQWQKCQQKSVRGFPKAV
jgi:hypothetical protein